MQIIFVTGEDNENYIDNGFKTSRNEDIILTPIDVNLDLGEFANLLKDNRTNVRITDARKLLETSSDSLTRKSRESIVTVFAIEIQKQYLPKELCQAIGLDTYDNEYLINIIVDFSQDT